MKTTYLTTLSKRLYSRLLLPINNTLILLCLLYTGSATALSAILIGHTKPLNNTTIIVNLPESWTVFYILTCRVDGTSYTFDLPEKIPSPTATSQLISDILVSGNTVTLMRSAGSIRSLTWAASEQLYYSLRLFDDDISNGELMEAEGLSSNMLELPFPHLPKKNLFSDGIFYSFGEEDNASIQGSPPEHIFRNQKALKQAVILLQQKKTPCHDHTWTKLWQDTFGDINAIEYELESDSPILRVFTSKHWYKFTCSSTSSYICVTRFQTPCAVLNFFKTGHQAPSFKIIHLGIDTVKASGINNMEETQKQIDILYQQQLVIYEKTQALSSVHQLMADIRKNQILPLQAQASSNRSRSPHRTWRDSKDYDSDDTPPCSPSSHHRSPEWLSSSPRRSTFSPVRPPISRSYPIQDHRLATSPKQLTPSAQPKS